MRKENLVLRKKDVEMLEQTFSNSISDKLFTFLTGGILKENQKNVSEFLLQPIFKVFQNNFIVFEKIFKSYGIHDTFSMNWALGNCIKNARPNIGDTGVMNHYENPSNGDNWIIACFDKQSKKMAENYDLFKERLYFFKYVSYSKAYDVILDKDNFEFDGIGGFLIPLEIIMEKQEVDKNLARRMRSYNACIVNFFRIFKTFLVMLQEEIAPVEE